jgi:hypothetical protein
LWQQQKRRADEERLKIMTLKRRNEEMGEMRRRMVRFVIYHTVSVCTANDDGKASSLR